MFGDRGGLSAASIGTIVAIGFALSVFFEVPTGVVADSIPRKYVLVVAIICKILALAAWLAFPFYWGYLLGSMFFALGSAFESGALQAYLYGTLGTAKKQSFGKFWSRVSAMVMISYTAAYVTATVVGPRYVPLLALSIAACSVGLLISLSLPRDTIAVATDATRTPIIASAVQHIFKTKALLRLLLGAVIVIAVSEVFVEFISVYFKQTGIPVRFIPLLLAASNVVGAVLFWTLHSWEKHLNTYKVWLAIGFSGIFVISFYGGTIGICLGALLFVRFVRVLQVQFESNIQHLSNDEARVTISSFGNFGAKLIAAGVVAIVGYSATNNNIVQPLRTALLAGMGLFVVTQLALRYNQQPAKRR